MFERDATPRRFAVIGLGRFGMEVVQTLAGRGHEVLAIDRLEGPVQHAKEIATHALQVEVIDEELVREVGLDEVEVAVVAIGDDVEASIFVTALLVEAGVPQVSARANSRLHGLILARVGATRVIYPEQESAAALAQHLRAPNVTDYFALGAGIGIVRLSTPRAWFGRTTDELRRAKPNPSVILAIQRGTETLAEPALNETLREGDLLVLLCPDDQIDEIPCDRPPRDSAKRR
ncbi:MAG TPA: TrkA family potassium uptake protein [Thermomicrobiales bacterium]|jgi:trk system potassium uptake protein TrkA